MRILLSYIELCLLSPNTGTYYPTSWICAYSHLRNPCNKHTITHPFALREDGLSQTPVRALTIKATKTLSSASTSFTPIFLYSGQAVDGFGVHNCSSCDISVAHAIC